MTRDINFHDDRDAVLNALGESIPSSPPPPLTYRPPQDDIVRHFIRAAKENGASTEMLAAEDEIPAAAARHLRALGAPHQAGAVCTPEWEHLPWRAAGMEVQGRTPEESDVCGITGVLAAAADCGAMSVSAGRARALSTSLLPPHHIAIVRARSILPSLADIFAPTRGVYALFCGPSRSADIEQTLTIGAHGPLSVHIVILKEAAKTAK